MFEQHVIQPTISIAMSKMSFSIYLDAYPAKSQRIYVLYSLHIYANIYAIIMQLLKVLKSKIKFYVIFYSALKLFFLD